MTEIDAAQHETKADLLRVLNSDAFLLQHDAVMAGVCLCVDLSEQIKRFAFRDRDGAELESKTHWQAQALLEPSLTLCRFVGINCILLAVATR